MNTLRIGFVVAGVLGSFAALVVSKSKTNVPNNDESLPSCEPVKSTNLLPNVLLKEVVEEIRRIQRQDGHEEQASQAPVAQTKTFYDGYDGGVWGTYVGELDANGLRHGEGTMTWDIGLVYEGEWQHDKHHGQGTLQWADGTSYEGEWKDGNMDGQGTYKGPDGDKYVGSWKADKMSGVGTFYFNSGQVFISRWEESKGSGEGVMWSADRRTAWHLNDGKPGRKIDLSAATAITSQLGFSEVP